MIALGLSQKSKPSLPAAAHSRAAGPKARQAVQRLASVPALFGSWFQCQTHNDPLIVPLEAYHCVPGYLSASHLCFLSRLGKTHTSFFLLCLLSSLFPHCTGICQCTVYRESNLFARVLKESSFKTSCESLLRLLVATPSAKRVEKFCFTIFREVF